MTKGRKHLSKLEVQEGGGTQTPAANSFPTCSGFSMIILRIVPCKEENKDSVMIVL